MDTADARAVLIQELARYRAKSYSELVQELLGKQDTYEVKSSSGVKYQVEIQAFWDDKPNDVLRVMGAIDDGGIRAYVPMSGDFLIAPTGEFIGE
jgi:hypothetical protein